MRLARKGPIGEIRVSCQLLRGSYTLTGESDVRAKFVKRMKDSEIRRCIISRFLSNTIIRAIIRVAKFLTHSSFSAK
jgi:hypothetical protein